MSRISERFAAARRDGSRLLIAYLTAGDPNLERTPALVAALERGGADIIELGVPFSDPVADGPVIQRASDRALKAGATMKGILAIASKIRETSDIPLLLFTYLNPALRYGMDRLAKDAAASGIDGCLLTDLSVEEAAPFTKPLRAAGLDTVFLAAPTSTPERLQQVAALSSGFVYLVSRTGVTGERDSLSQGVNPLVEAMRKATDLPLALGFGISKPEHSRAAGELCEGVVVGSAIVRLIEQSAADPDLESKLETLARSLKDPLKARP